MRIGLATIQFGRRDHLLRQADQVADMEEVSDYIVVSMDQTPPDVRHARVVHMPIADAAALPLAAARNCALSATSDCDLVVMLDVDCLPSPGLASAYASAARGLSDRPVLLSGPVGYLASSATPTAADLQHARTRVVRDFPSVGQRREPRPELFWSLSFAVVPSTHQLIGGFDEAFCGYGAEDTDYGMRAAERGVELWFVADAWAYHQPHPPSSRDAEPVAALVANANRFYGRWGFWPMPGELSALEERGLVTKTSDGALVAQGEVDDE